MSKGYKVNGKQNHQTEQKWTSREVAYLNLNIGSKKGTQKKFPLRF